MLTSKPRSLLRRLLLGFSAVLLVIWLGVLIYVLARASAQQERLTTVLNINWARKVLLLAQSAPSVAQLQANGAAMEVLRQQVHADLQLEGGNVTRIWLHGQLAYSSRAEAPLPAPPRQRASVSRAGDWVRCVERDPARDLVVESSQQLLGDWHQAVVEASLRLGPLVFGLPLMGLLSWALARMGLRPLHRLAGHLAGRNASDLTPIADSGYVELAPLEQAINTLMQHLGDRLARERNFLADAAHELKTPLAVIRTNAHLLAQAGAAGPSHWQAALQGLNEGTERANRVVQQLLTYERVSTASTAAPPPPVDLRDLVRTAVAHAAPQALKRGIDIGLEAALPCVLPLAPESMISLLDNIIGNAIKYSPDHGKILVRLQSDSAGTTLQVDDAGPGIAPALRQKVFERFYRVPGQDVAGSGLGLSIAERAAARNGATIELADTPQGAGLRVTVHFPPPAPAAVVESP